MSIVIPVHKKTILINASSPKSLILFRKEMIATLIAAGYDVHTSAPEIPASVHDQLVEIGAKPHSVPLQRTGMSFRADMRYLASLSKLMKKTNADLVIGYTIKPNIWGSFAAKTRGLPSYSMVTGLGYTFLVRDTLKSRTVGRFSKLLYSLTTRINEKVVFQNPDDIQDFVKAKCLSQPEKAVLVDGSGVDIEYFSPVALPEAPSFLLIGRLLKSKGVREYTEAAQQVIEQVPDARIAIGGGLDIGPDSIEPRELEDWAKSGIEVLGPLSDVRAAIANCSVYVLPSYREGTPRTVLEAMAMGRPIITTDAPGCRETVDDGINGLLVPIKDSESLKNAMLSLAVDQKLRSKMGNSSRTKAESKYSVRTVTDSLLTQLGLI